MRWRQGAWWGRLDFMKDNRARRKGMFGPREKRSRDFKETTTVDRQSRDQL